MPRFTVSSVVREAVRNRALKCCEYCKSQDKYSPTAFTIDHVLPESLDGTSDIENLAYACFLCNRLKSNKLKVFDTITEKWMPLFSPRQHNWNDHFRGVKMQRRLLVSPPLGVAQLRNFG